MSITHMSPRASRPIWRRMILSAGASAFFAALPAVAAPLDPSGLWFTKNNDSIIKIAPCGANYCGTLAWMKEPNDTDGTPKVDHLNSDTTKRARPMVGIDLLLDMAADQNQWRGKAYNPEDGKVYDITFKLVADKVPADKAEIQGCVLKFLCQTSTFTRATAIPKPAASR